MIEEYLRPDSIKEAVAALKNPGSAVLGGGTWLNAGPGAAYRRLISLEKLGLDQISLERNTLVLGAGASFQQVINSDKAPRFLKDALLLTPSRTLRNMVTLGGDLAAGFPESTLIPALFTGNAMVVLAEEEKNLSVEEYVKTKPKNLILQITMARQQGKHAIQCISKTAHGPKSMVVAVYLLLQKNLVTDVHVVVSDCVRQSSRLFRLESMLRGGLLPKKSLLERGVKDELDPEDDRYASREYKKYIAGVLISDMLYRLATDGADR